MYSVTTDRPNNLVHIKISGFWTQDVMAPFAADLKKAVDSLNIPAGTHLVMIDVSNVAIQSQSIIAAFQQLIANGPTKSRKFALYTTKMLPRMQARRVAAVRENGSVFASREEAQAWLLAPDAADTSPAIVEAYAQPQVAAGVGHHLMA